MIHRTLKAIAVIGFVLIMLASLVTASEADRMSQDDLKLKLGGADIVIVDVRSYTDWTLSSEKIKGALREDYRDFKGWAAKYPRDRTIVLYCA
jgi:rhodanese-related sulfurtransferase